MTDPMSELDSPAATRLAVVSIAIAFEGAFVLVAILVGPLIGVKPLSLVSFDASAVGWGVATASAAFGLVVLGVEGDISLLRETTRSVEVVVERLFAKCTTIDLLAISALAGVGEELLFRGVMQSGLDAATGPVVALIVTSLLFGLAHFMSMSYFLYATIFGVVVGGLFLLVDNLLAPIIAHAVYDFLALVYLVRRHRNREVISSSHD